MLKVSQPQPSAVYNFRSINPTPMILLDQSSASETSVLIATNRFPRVSDHVSLAKLSGGPV